MNISLRTVRQAKRGVNAAHKAFHAIVRENVDHKPGYDDGVAALVLARLDEIECKLQNTRDEITKLLKRRRVNHPLTAWQKHVAKELRAGRSIQQAAQSWREGEVE